MQAVLNGGFKRFLAMAGVCLCLSGYAHAETHEERIRQKQTQPGSLARSAADVRCTVPKAPTIRVLPQTADIKYDYSKSTAELTARGSNTVNPYAANLDTTTGGLRADAPVIKSSIKMGTMTYPSLGVGCMWYDSVIVDIKLAPTIFIAKEFQQEPCKSAIVGHEVKHVAVDREVMNKYALEIGKAIQAAVNQVGAMGPFNANEMSSYQDQYIKHVQSAINSQELLLTKEMRMKQGQVDSIQEYERVGSYCKDIRKNRR